MKILTLFSLLLICFACQDRKLSNKELFLKYYEVNLEACKKPLIEYCIFSYLCKNHHL